MKVLLDMGLAPRTADFLQGIGHDSRHIGLLGFPKLSDEEIMARAAAEDRTLITFDLDFSRILALQRRVQPSVVLIRLEQFTTEKINLLLGEVLERYGGDLEKGAIIVVDPHRIRIRSLPIWG